MPASNIFSNLIQGIVGESALLSAILNMSITGGVVILFVLLIRVLLKKAPKIFSYALWAVVLFRLLCPVSVTTDFSLLRFLDAPATGATEHTSVVEYVPQGSVSVPAPGTQRPVADPGNTGIGTPAVTIPQGGGQAEVVPQNPPQTVPQDEPKPNTPTPVQKAQIPVATVIWLAGVSAMAAYSVISYLLLRRRLIGSVPLRDNIYLADYIDSPFVMGFFRPKIYLPTVLSAQEQSYIILHEQHHIRRLDHMIKVLAFIALCIHWFNPLVWVAFVLSSKDMEMSCDEAVVKKLGEEIRADYSASLLSLATGRRIIAGTPLAFGEGDTKSRIRNMMSWKRAKPAVVFLAAAAVILAVVFCGTNQTSYTRTADEDTAAYLHRLRGAYRLDSSRIEQMVEALELEELGDYEFYGIYRSEGGFFPRKRYELTVHFSHEPEDEATFNEEMEQRACVLLGLIGNLEHVTYSYLRGDQTMTASYFYSALDRPADGLDDTIGRLCRTEEGLRKLLEHWDSEEADEPKPSAPETEDISVPVQGAYGSVGDIAYYLELSAPGVSFRDMDESRKEALLAEYGDLLDGYSLIARESVDGKSAYIAGSYNGDVTDSPLYMMYGVELNTGAEITDQLLYREEDSAAVEEILLKQTKPTVGWLIQNSRISYSNSSGAILILPEESELSLNVGLNRYLYTPNGREYIADAASRGIDMCSRTEPFLYVYRISDRFGEIAERISLTEAEAKAIQAEERVNIMEGFGFSATLHLDGQTTYYSERDGIPQTVLDLAVERCDYRFGDPGMITDTIREARLDCDWLDGPLYADAEDLPRLREILKNAEFGYVGSCGYGAELTLTFTGGEKLLIFKGTDGCDTIVFGSYSGYFIGDQENTEFWEMFGLDPSTKNPIGSADQPDNAGANQYPPPTEEDITSAVAANIRKALTENGGEGSALADAFLTEAHAVLAQEQPDETTAVVYLLAHYASYVPTARAFTLEAFYNLPTVLTFTRERGEWELSAFRTLPDAVSAEAVFPADAMVILGSRERDAIASEQYEQCDKKARTYFAAQPRPAVSNAPFVNQAISWNSPLNGMFERTYETQLSMLGSIDRTSPPFFRQQTLEFDSCAVVLGESVEVANGSRFGTAYILFRDGALGELPLPMNADGVTVCPDTVQSPVSHALTYSVKAVGGTCYYVVDLERRTVSMSVGTQPALPEPPAPLLPAEPPTDEEIRAALAANHAGIEKSHLGAINAATPFRTESWLLLLRDNTETTYTYELLTCHAVYDLLGSGTNTRYEAVAECLHATALTFTRDNGSWKLTEYWTPGDGAYYEMDVQAKFHPLSADFVFSERAVEWAAEEKAQRDDAAVRYYAKLTGWVPAKTFYPSDVEFSGRTLYTSADAMTYAQRLAWAQAGEDNGNVWPACTGQYSEGEGCIAYVEKIVAGRYPELSLHIRFDDGTVSVLPLPWAGGYDTALPETMKFRDGKFIYEITFPTEDLTSEGQTLIHLKGTYHYEVDLTAKTVSLTVLQ